MTPYDFRYQALPMRVRFGAGAVSTLGDELSHLGLRRAAVVCTGAEADLSGLVAGTVGDVVALVLPDAVMHVPVEAVEAALDAVIGSAADSLVPVGGGSAVGLAKAVALQSGLPIVAVPTTYAGSEMTPIWGLTSGGVKRTGRDLRVLPRSVIYDPDLTLTLPAHVSGVSGMNAIAHAVEALYAPDGSPIVTLMALEGVKALAEALAEVVMTPHDRAARATALYGAWLCGACLGSVTMSLHHKLCHALGGAFDLPHADLHARPPLRCRLQRTRCTDCHVASGGCAERRRPGQRAMAARADSGRATVAGGPRPDRERRGARRRPGRGQPLRQPRAGD